MNNASFAALLLFLLAIPASSGAEYHVALDGRDSNPGSRVAPFRTIQHAAALAQPGDIVTVHAGTYRERVNPPRGGTSDRERIVYQAAPGERVEIKGSEVVTNWAPVQAGVWKVTLPNSFFGSFNPYRDLIRGDWFESRGRPHHTGAVYLNGDWLIEAAKLEEVLMPPGTVPAWLSPSGPEYLVNVAWLRPDNQPEPAGRIPAASYTSQQGVQKAPCSEGGECIGWIDAGDWVRFDQVNLGSGAENILLRAASATSGGTVEVRLGDPEGELLGSVPVPNTGGWQSWSSFRAPIKRTAGTRSLCLVFKGGPASQEKKMASAPSLWFAQVDESSTTIWAQFQVNPNEHLTEINVRQTVFYPDKPGRDFITVRGFALHQAATPWAPPTAEQMGLLGTHWSRGWVVESNVISHSVCSGIALGKYGDQYDNTSANTAEGYVKTIERALANGWHKDRVGGHLIRGNTISHCEQAGIVGSLGAAFSTVTGNTIHDIHVRRLFTGAEMAGIKFHAAIDSVISHNHIFRTCLGLWLDWMAQGTRVSGNLFHDNAGQDLFVEVNHGPFVVDNNLFLSPVSLLDMSEGGAYAHNLFTGRIISRPELGRQTPFHPPHSTQVAGLVNIQGGDNRFYNNILVGTGQPGPEAGTPAPKDPQWTGGSGLWVYNYRALPTTASGNVFYRGAVPCERESDALVLTQVDPEIRLISPQWQLHSRAGADLPASHKTKLVTTALLGKAAIPGVAYENADGSPLAIDTDYFGNKRSATRPTPGPFEDPSAAPRSVHKGLGAL